MNTMILLAASFFTFYYFSLEKSSLKISDLALKETEGAINLGNNILVFPRIQYVSPEEKAPMVIVFHGRNGSEKQLQNMIPKDIKARIFFFRANLKGNLFFEPRLKDDPVLVGKAIDEEMDLLVPAIDALINNFPTSRLISYGYSQGGAISLYLGSIGKVNAAISSSGALPSTLYPEKTYPSKIRMWHGSKDQVVPFKMAEKTFEDFQQENFNVTLNTKSLTHVMPPKDWVNKTFEEVLK